MHAEHVHQKAQKSQLRTPIGLDHHGLGQSPPPLTFSGYRPAAVYSI